MRAVLGNVAKKYQKDVAEWLKMALEDEMEMQQFRSRVIGVFSSDQSFMRLVYRY
jgi:disulfide oxidoreductase YuzD